MTDGNGDPPFSAAKPVKNRHTARFGTCIHCDTPTEHKLPLPGTFPPAEYDWCPRCRMAMWCGCEILRALARI